MGNRKYESPKVDFQEMKLLERVADKCWGYSYAWYDADKDGVIDGGEKVQLGSLGLGANGCQGNAAESALKKYYKDNFSIDLSDNDVKVNTKSKTVIGSNS